MSRRAGLMQRVGTWCRSLVDPTRSERDDHSNFGNHNWNADDDVLEENRRVLVDAHTRTFWSRGSEAGTTLVETDGFSDLIGKRRVTALIEDHERGSASRHGSRPRANPAFSEGVFVELMRAQRYDRAFELLAPQCREAWGDARAFGAAQRLGALRHLQGVKVIAVRHRQGWMDPDSGVFHSDVAEIDAEYTLDNGRRRLVVPRSVHLVGVDGAWRSLCYPAVAEQAESDLPDTPGEVTASLARSRN